MSFDLKILKQVLRDFFRINFLYIDEPLLNLWINKYHSHYENKQCYMNITYELFNIIQPAYVLNYEFYFHELLPNEIIYLTCQALNKYKLKATKQQIHELSFQANNMYLSWKYADEGPFNDLSYAVNSVIKLFREDKWETPYEFLGNFNEYKEKIKLE
jgi:hypothetical protein